MLNSRRTVQSVCTLAPPPLLSCQNVWDRGHHLTSPPQQCCRKGAQWWDLSSDCVVVADDFIMLAAGFIMLAECVGLNVLSFILTVLGEEQAKSKTTGESSQQIPKKVRAEELAVPAQGVPPTFSEVENRDGSGSRATPAATAIRCRERLAVRSGGRFLFGAL